jgi:opacity protein-like surface antigen
MSRRLTVIMKSLLLASLGLVLAVSPAFATAVVPPPIAPPHAADPGTVSIDAFTSGVQATIFRNDGTQSGSVDALLTQFDVTYRNSDGTLVPFATFCIDLFHTVSAGQVYPVILRDSLDPFFVNGDRMAYVLAHFGASNLSGAPDQAAAVQIALWDLSLNNHAPTSFALDTDGTYSSGDESVFNVDFGSNPDASAIASLVNQYLVASEGATTSGSWLDAGAAGDGAQRGQSLLLPPRFVIAPNGLDIVAAPLPPSSVLMITGLVVLCRVRAILHRRRRADGKRRMGTDA